MGVDSDECKGGAGVGAGGEGDDGDGGNKGSSSQMEVDSVRRWRPSFTLRIRSTGAKLKSAYIRSVAGRVDGRLARGLAIGEDPYEDGAHLLRHEFAAEKLMEIAQAFEGVSGGGVSTEAGDAGVLFAGGADTGGSSLLGAGSDHQRYVRDVTSGQG